MTNKRIRLPKEGLVDRDGGSTSEFDDASKDVEGHWLPNPAPPADFSKGGTGHGGEAMPGSDDEGDVEASRQS